MKSCIHQRRGVLLENCDRNEEVGFFPSDFLEVINNFGNLLTSQCMYTVYELPVVASCTQLAVVGLFYC